LILKGIAYKWNSYSNCAKSPRKITTVKACGFWEETVNRIHAILVVSMLCWWCWQFTISFFDGFRDEIVFHELVQSGKKCGSTFLYVCVRDVAKTSYKVAHRIWVSPSQKCFCTLCWNSWTETTRLVMPRMTCFRNSS
jgi:hypothetical protein